MNTPGITSGNPFKAALQRSQAQVGLWLAMANPYLAEVSATAGFDWLLIDTEHAPNDLHSTLAALQAVSPYRAQPVVRALHADTALIKQLLDIGVQNLLVPMVDTAEQAAQLVRAMRYPQDDGHGGVRGMAGARASRWGHIKHYAKLANEQVCLLVQAESGLISVSGAPGEWGRIGVSLCDITAGMNALIGIQQALLQRTVTGRGSGVRVSLFDSAAELMSVPYLQGRYGGKAPERVGLKHPTITPYGVFTCADGRELVISIQNEREWADFCRQVLQRPDLLQDPRCVNNAARCANRAFVDGLVSDVFGGLGCGEVIDRLTAAQTAYGNVNSVYDLIQHTQLRTRAMQVGTAKVQVPASPWQVEWEDTNFPPVPRIDEHGAALRNEFAPADEAVL